MTLKFHQIFRAALHEPKKLAAFRLLPIGRVIRYVFVFITIYSIVSFFQFVSGDASIFDASPELLMHGEKIGWIVYPIAFLLQFVIITFYVFIRISLFGAIGLLLLTLLKRRGEYRHIWRTAAIAATVPTIFVMISDFIPLLKSISFVGTSFIHLLYIMSAIRYYPKAPR